MNQGGNPMFGETSSETLTLGQLRDGWGGLLNVVANGPDPVGLLHPDVHLVTVNTD